ncbi:MAG: hypothetical protein IPL99_15730 [Candidatus Competibacteraceae bacterium]|nr:hypothetical protein [Candidatus Competibacteraceae bacterium]
MFSASLWLAAATFAGLALGLIREILLVQLWGASGVTDALVLALFVPDAVRIALAAGLLAAAAVPIWRVLDEPVRRHQWAAIQTLNGLLMSAIVATLLSQTAGLWVDLLGPGLAGNRHALAVRLFAILVWTLPWLSLHGLLSVFHQASQRFLLQGLGAVFFSGPCVLYLAIMNINAQPESFANWVVVGSALMAVPLLPHAWRRAGGLGRGSYPLPMSAPYINEFGRYW